MIVPEPPEAVQVNVVLFVGSVNVMSEPQVTDGGVGAALTVTVCVFWQVNPLLSVTVQVKT